MLFSSLEFLFLYALVSLPLYFLTPMRWRCVTLLLVSLIFYGWGEPIYVFLMIFTIAVDYAFGLIVGKNRDNKKGKAALITAIVINLGILAFFKYCDFFIVNLAKIPALSSLEPLRIEMPIGISFYTFQALSYVIDVYRHDADAQKNPIAFGTYVTLFPQLIAGPIVRYKDVDDQLTSREHSVALAASGVRTFMAGLGKKVIIANTAGAMWQAALAIPDAERTAVAAWMGIIWYTVQIYFDFSGYSDMAIGLGKILGFRFLENFNYPYISKSITEFWRRWHISLSSWFREYLYIPLGGNRVSKGRMYLNLLIVWFLTGFWHGSGWTFILWGLYYFTLLAIEKAFLGKLIEKLPSLCRHLYTMLAVIFGWLLFASPDISSYFAYFKTMFGAGAGFASGLDLYELARNLIFGAIAVIGATPLPKRLFMKLYKKSAVTSALTVVGSVALLVLVTAYLVDSSFNPFLYWSF